MDQMKVKNELVEWVKAIGIALVIAWGVRYFLFTPVEVEGASMMPTFEEGERVVVNKIGPRLTEYHRFDVVVFKATEDKNYIKRVIGLPGDHIEYKDDVLYINGKPYQEPYLDQYKEELTDKLPLTEDFAMEDYLSEDVVPEGHLFVLGDNRRRSSDSRYTDVGFVPMDRVIGTTSLVYWPVNDFRFIKNE